MEEAGYIVPKGPDGQAGIVINAADQGSVLDRSRLFTLAVTKELYDRSTKDKEFKWPKDKVDNTRKLRDIFREPVDPSHIAPKHVMEGFHDKKWRTRTGVQYKYTKGTGIGEWYNPNTVISEEGKGLSITAMGNSRWIEFTDVDGEKKWRRLSGVETARAFGMEETELDRFQHLNDQEIHAAVGNGVCIEMGEAMGEVVQQFWDPKWFQDQCKKKIKEDDVFCVQEGTINTGNETKVSKLIGQMSEKNKVRAEGIRQRQHAKADQRKTRAEHAECNRLDLKEKDKANMRRIAKQHEGEVRSDSKKKIERHYAKAAQNERMKFRRRVRTVIKNTRNLNSLEWDVSVEKAAIDGTAGIWDEAEVFRNESPELVDHEFAWKGKQPAPEIIDPTTPMLENAELIRAQKKDPRYQNLIKFMEGRLDKEVSTAEKAELKREAERYCFVNNVLCRITSSERTGSTVRVCVPSSFQDELMRMCHDNPWTCHPTTDQMFRMLSLRYHWPQMRMSCAMYHSTCDTCQRTGYPPRRNAGGRQYIPTSSPFACVAIDVVGPIGNKDAVTEDGKRMIVTVIDWFTRYIEAYAVKDCSERSIIDCLEHFTSRHGIPRRVVSDQAKYFRGKLIHQWEKQNGLKHTFVSTYRPQGNGKLERFHRVLGRKIKQQCYDAGDEQWDKYLEKITFAHNITPHSVTGYSPYELIHGRLPVAPFDTLMPPTEEDSSVSHGAYMDKINRRNITAWQIAHENMADKQTESTNLVAAENMTIKNYKAGDSIMLWVPSIPKQKSKKLTCKWHGPYKVTEVNKGKQVTITMPDGHGGMKDRSVHQARVKRFHDRIKAASYKESDDVFELLEQYEANKIEDESSNRNGLDLLEKFPNKEHITKGYAHTEGKWEMLWDGTERVGMVAGQAEGTMDPEVPIGLENKSPFDSQQLIEQTILDLTQNDNLLLKRCQECNKAQEVQHSCQECFERISRKEFTSEEEQIKMKYPMFREVTQDIQDPGKTEETECDICQKSIWIPREYCRCGEEGVQTEGHTDVETGEPFPAVTVACPMHPHDDDDGDAIKMAFNMSYPVIIQEGEVRPRVYEGKTSLPPKRKGQLWQQVEKLVEPQKESSSESSDNEAEAEHPVKEKKETKDQIYEAKSIIDYDEWEYKYKVTWKGYADETEQGVQDLVAAESLVEEYWADPDTGVKKWKRLRPKMDNMKQQMEMLKSQDQMSKANIKIAGVQLRQAIGKSKEQVYKRLQAQEIRTTDVFHVVLDAKVTRLEGMTKKEKAKSEAGGKCKMIIPVKWTWNKLQSVCRKDQVTDIRNGLAQAAKQAQHTHWTKDYKDMATMGGAINPSREEFLVISTEKVICRIEEAGEQAKQQRHRLDQWSTQEQKTLAGVKEQKQYEAWLEVKSTQQEQDTIHDATATREANQEQMKRDALTRLQAWGKRAQNGRWLECPHGAVRIEGHQRRPYGFVMGDGSPMPRCKNKKCVEQMKTFELSKKYQDALNKLKHQDTDKTITRQVNGRSSSRREDDNKKKHEDVQDAELYTTRRSTTFRTSRTRQDGRDGSAQGSTTDLTNDERNSSIQESTTH